MNRRIINTQLLLLIRNIADKQQVQPAWSMVHRLSQQAWIISQQALSPLVQVMHMPSLVMSHLHIPMVRLQVQIIMPFIRTQ